MRTYCFSSYEMEPGSTLISNASGLSSYQTWQAWRVYYYPTWEALYASTNVNGIPTSGTVVASGPNTGVDGTWAVGWVPLEGNVDYNGQMYYGPLQGVYVRMGENAAVGAYIIYAPNVENHDLFYIGFPGECPYQPTLEEQDQYGEHTEQHFGQATIYSLSARGDLIWNPPAPQSFLTTSFRPEVCTSEGCGGTLLITWSEVALADAYRLYKNNTLIYEGTDLQHTDTTVSTGETHTYKVTSIKYVS